MMKHKMVLVSLLGWFFAPSAFAMPIAPDTAAQSSLAGVEKTAVVCDEWGRCWQTNPYSGRGYYGGYYRGYYPGYYPGYGGRGGNGDGYYRGGGDWDRDGGARQEWDGRDWHGGRWREY
jgi:hypothetical protein